MQYMNDKFNKYYKNLKFTHEKEVGNQINFLDVLVRNVSGVVETNRY